ncbi:PQQ-dependent sugar dehydrogenase [Streptomyces johnsoniae]|uniref:PQQ-dependent sugar dehydrogenase n=1 Tax=Streptomyces johnsoniae TaxID=3075532 RepID=A0ABU2S0A1_9ACTN|nr:PQQ-dependent sugar dehydrogenase [Streptomyces sp. DSM 41886]MDT0442111.1 PQQ-dependent sugar dehydrogenase [Streptomyces sp. DSM 41886]
MGRRVAVVAVTGALAAGCSIGPAADRAERESSSARPTPTGDPSVPEPGGDATEDARPGPSPAPATGTATATDTEATGLTGACCVAGLPDSEDLLVGSGDTVLLHRADGDGELAEIGTVPGELLALAVPSQATGNQVRVVAFYAGPEGGEIVSYLYYPDKDSDPWGQSGSTLLREPIPLGGDAGRGGAVLAFGPDGELYAGTGDAGDPELAADETSLAGKILQIDPNQSRQQPTVHSPGPYTDVRGLAWDGDRMWAVDAGEDGGTRLLSVVPGGEPVEKWETADEAPAGLAASRGSLWMPGSDGGQLWRIPLNGGTGLVSDPQEVLDVTEPRGIFPVAGSDELRLLSGDDLVRLDVT